MPSCELCIFFMCPKCGTDSFAFKCMHPYECFHCRTSGVLILPLHATILIFSCMHLYRQAQADSSKPHSTSHARTKCSGASASTTTSAGTHRANTLLAMAGKCPKKKPGDMPSPTVHLNEDTVCAVSGSCEKNRFASIGEWTVPGWTSSTDRIAAEPIIDYETCRLLACDDEWQSRDLIHFTTLEWLYGPAMEGLPNTLNTCTNSSFDVKAWSALKGMSANVWATPQMHAIQKVWAQPSWKETVNRVKVHDLMTCMQKGDRHVLLELYQEVFIRGTVPWSDWWTLSQEESFLVDSDSKRGSVEASSSNLRIIDGPTSSVRMHPLIGSLGGIFDSGCDGKTIQVPDPLGRPFRKIPTDYHLNTMCLATQPDGTHFIAAGAVNLKAAYSDMTDKATRGHEFVMLGMDSSNMCSDAFLNHLLQTMRLVSRACQFMEGQAFEDVTVFDKNLAVQLIKTRNMFYKPVTVPRQTCGVTCALHASCNMQRMHAMCRAKTKSVELGRQLELYPDPLSWVNRVMEKTKTVMFGSFPVEAACTMLYLRRVMLSKLGALSGGADTTLYKSLERSIARMTNPPQHMLSGSVFVDIRGRMRVYRTCMCTEFDSTEVRRKEAGRTYIL